MPRRLIYIATLAALAALACTSASQEADGADELTPSAPAEATLTMRVGSAGGVVELGDARLEVPSGALEDPVQIRIERFARKEIPEGFVGASDLFRFHPNGLTFDKPATVHIPVTGDATGAQLYWSNDSGGFDVVDGATIEDGVMVGQVEHFSFGFVGRAVDVTGDPVASGVCAGAPVCEELLHPRANKLDLLFVVDNSGSMAEEQAALARELPRMVKALTTGDLDADGVADIAPVQDVHIGAVSTDMGLPGIAGIDKCDGAGDDGKLRQAQAGDACDGAEFPLFLTYDGSSSPSAQDLMCMTSLGTDGCGFEHPLEAALKAVTPSEGSEITFLSLDGSNQGGHGDGFNGSFFRNDPRDPSMVAVVVITDEEDCSATDTSLFTPPMSLAVDDPLREQDLNLRCHLNADKLYSVERYVNGLKALRPGNENLVFFAAIAGVPGDLVSSEALEGHDFGDPAELNQFYDDLLADARMQEVIDETLPMGSRSLLPSCDTPTGTAYPPRRIAEVARGFGPNGIIQSICQDDFGPAIEPILQRLGANLGGACTASEFDRSAGGRIACDLVVQLPAGASCDDADYLESIEGEAGLCAMRQLAVADAQAEAGEGWYYDDFSVRAQLCPGDLDHAIVLSASAEVMSGAKSYLRCP